MSAQTMSADDGTLQGSLRKPFVGSVALHALLIGGSAIYALWIGSGDKLGDPHAGGAAVGVTAISSIPIPNHGPENPVAEDTKSRAPQEAAPEKPKVKPKPEKDPDDAVALKQSKEKQVKAPPPPKFKPFSEMAPNQIPVKSPQAASNPMFTQQAGAGQIDNGKNTTLGNMFPGYSSQIRELVARKWNTGSVDQRYHTAPTVIATFDLMRNGEVRNIKLLQTSGISTLDASVKRAIEDASPLPPIPPGYNKDSISVEFWFELKR